MEVFISEFWNAWDLLVIHNTLLKSLCSCERRLDQ